MSSQQEEETNFIVTTKINEFPMKDLSPMAIAFNYPILAVVTSSNHIVTFNFETKITIHLERQTATDNPALCADISKDKTQIATGHADGEVVLWSLQTRTAVLSQKTSEPISYIAFGTDLNIFHCDSNGSLCRTSITQNIFKRSVNTTVLYNFDQPLTALRVHENIIYVSTCAETIAFLYQPEFKVLWTDNAASSCFAFLQTPTVKLIGRGVGHSVVISDFNGVTKKIVEFSQTPNVVSLLLQTPNINYNALDRRHRTALHIAALSKSMDIYQLLSEVIDVSILDDKGRTAADIINGGSVIYASIY